jgi:hypothetical protein
MKTLRTFFATVITSLLVTGIVLAQNSTGNQVAVPLSNPGKPGKLVASLISGSITVTGYDGKNVVIRYDFKGKKEDEDQPKPPPPGLKRIPNVGGGLEATEKDNVVTVNTGFRMHDADLQIMTPHNFSLHLSTVNNGDIVVKDVSGEMEISNINGDITMKDISGSVVANTVNGDMKVSFEKITPDVPMSFTTLNGDVDVSLPSNAKFTARMKTDQGDIYTDFDMDLSSSPTPKVVTSNKGGVYKVSVGDWRYAKVNGGGPELTFKSFNGDISIRKDK